MITAIDERSAAFLALGLATGSGRAVAVVTTSGTAVANLLPAVVEADRSTQPLLLLTADRPRRLKNRGANQTVNQEEFLLSACRRVMTPSSDGLHGLEASALLECATDAWNWAHAPMAGPVQLNLAFEEPLHASREEQQALGSVVVARRRSSSFRCHGLGLLSGHLNLIQRDRVWWWPVPGGGCGGKNRPISRPFTIG